MTEPNDMPDREIDVLCALARQYELADDPPYNLAFRDLAVALRALQQERDQLKEKAMGWESHASHVVAHNKEVTPCLPTKGIAFTVPLRANFMAQLVLPFDLSEAEAQRLAAMLETLVMPATDAGNTP